MRAPACSQAARHPDRLLARAHRDPAELARRQHHRRGRTAQLVDVVAEPRAVDQLDRGEQRVLAGVPAVAGEVEHVDLARPAPRPGRRSRPSPRSTARVRPRRGRPGDLLRAPRHPGPATRPTRSPGAAPRAAPASGSPTGGMVSGRPTRPGSRDHGVPARAPDGVSTSRRSPSERRATGPPAGRPTTAGSRRSAARRWRGQRAVRCAAAMSGRR